MKKIYSLHPSRQKQLPIASPRAKFRRIFHEEQFKDENAIFGPALLGNLQNKIVIFVGGLLNELAGILHLYFNDARKLLESQKIKTFYHGYSSATPVHINSEQLFNDLKEHYKTTGKKIILVGHSMGGAEALYTVLMAPNLITLGIVEKVVLISPAIGGSVLAERLRFGFVGRIIQKLIADGLRSLTPEISRQIFRSALEVFRAYHLSPEKLARFNESIFYIRFATTRPHGIDLSIATKFCDTTRFVGIENDGLLRTDAQILPGIGIDLGVLEADHIQYVISGPLSRASSADRKRFTRAFLRAIYPTMLTAH